ncbi:MAG: hypothetical protein ACLQE9_17810 [Roseiarcus sp.]
MRARHLVFSPAVAAPTLLLLGYFLIPAWSAVGGGHAPGGHGLAAVGHVGVVGVSSAAVGRVGVVGVSPAAAVGVSSASAVGAVGAVGPVGHTGVVGRGRVSNAPVGVTSVPAPVSKSIVGVAQVSAPVGFAAPADPAPAPGAPAPRMISTAWMPNDNSSVWMVEALTEQAQAALSSCSLDSPDCIADILDRYAAALQRIAPRLPPELRKLPAIVAAAARRARASTSPREAVLALRGAVAEVHKAIALLKADDPMTLKAETREGTLVVGTLLVAQNKLETAFGI